MHGAKMNRAETDVDNRRTKDGTLRTASPPERICLTPLWLSSWLEQPYMYIFIHAYMYNWKRVFVSALAVFANAVCSCAR